MYNIIWKDPEIILDNYIDVKYAFDLWLKSRDFVTTRNADGSINQINGETINNMSEYMDRVFKMGLQYVNFPKFSFHIFGSILFRDICFNINRTSQWSESTGFKHEQLKDFNITNYPMSKEYEHSEKWNNAIVEYFDHIQKNFEDIDIQREKMPYCLYSEYWVQFDWQTLVSFLAMLKMRMPFFYENYGLKIINSVNKELNIDIEKYLPNYIDTRIDQYFYDDFNKSYEEVDNYMEVGDSVVLRYNLPLIAYSQFIRQIDTRTKGLFDLIVNTTKDYVITSQTIIPMTYYADKKRWYRTISNRTCQLIIHKTWTPILNLMLKKMSYDDFKKIMSCKCKDGHVVCKFWEDLKYRYSGNNTQAQKCGIALMDRNIIEDNKKRNSSILVDNLEKLFEEWNSKGIKKENRLL